LIEDVSSEFEKVMTRLAANAPETQELLAAAHGAGMTPSRLAIREMSIRLELQVSETRSVAGSAGIGLAALPIGAYVRGAYRGVAESACVLELEIRQTPVQPAQPRRR
jgi:hypothetical protein